MHLALVSAALLVAPPFGGAGVEVAEYDKAASEVATTLIRQFGEAMRREMAKGGPTEAVKVCADLAPEIAGRLSREQGWRVTRVGTRVRNPLLGMPDAWEQQVLATFAERAAKGEDLMGMTHSEMVTEPNGRYYRFMKPIVVQLHCLLCHGPVEHLPEEIKAVLKEKYPFDQATGYQAGDLRGAVSIKRPVGAER